MAAQLTSMKGVWARLPLAWMDLAIELLARAVLARDQDAGVARRGLLDEGADLGQGRRGADEGLGLDGRRCGAL